VLLIQIAGSLFYASPNKPELAPYVQPCGPRERVAIVLELGIACGAQVAAFYLCGGTWGQYVWAGPVAFGFGSVFSSLYLLTQHGLHPLSVRPDALRGTTSIALPRWLDVLHVHHSYHVEHHLFPSLNSDYYPHVSQLLRERYAAAYSRLGMFEVWRRLQHNEAFRPEPEGFADRGKTCDRST
jgi:fatty acid desaturase